MTGGSTQPPPQGERILPANTRQGEPYLPLNHPRITTRGDYVYPWTTSRVVGTVAVFVVLGVLAALGVTALISRHSLLAQQDAGALGSRVTRPGAAPATPAPDEPGASSVAVPAAAPTVIGPQPPTPTFAPTLQMVTNRLELQGGAIVQVGEYRNNAPRVASRVVVVVTFKDTEGKTIDSGTATIGVILPGKSAVWRVAVPAQPNVTQTAISVTAQWGP